MSPRIVSPLALQGSHGASQCGTRHATRATQQGQMLMVALWVMGLVSLAAGTIAVRSVSTSQLGTVLFAATQRKALTDAGIEQGLHLIEQDTAQAGTVDTLQEAWATCRDSAGTSLCEQLSIGAGTVSIGQRQGDQLMLGLIDEERKLNVNTASADQLSRLIALASPDTPNRDQLAAAIIDWRDPGANTPACDEAQLGYACHNGPFESVDELRLVSGFTPELFAALEPYVTVYGSGFVNINTAPTLVLNALGYPADTIVQERGRAPFTEPPAEYPGTVVVSTAFTAPAEAEMPGVSGRLAVRAVIDRAGHILAWLPQ